MPDYLAPPDLPAAGNEKSADQDIDEAEFSSSNLAGGRYDAKKGELTLTFVRDGRQYRYSGVTPEAWENLKLSGSAGKFFRDEIMGLPTERLS